MPGKKRPIAQKPLRGSTKIPQTNRMFHQTSPHLHHQNSLRMGIHDTMAMVTASTSNGRSTVLCVCIYCVYSSLIMRVLDRWLPGIFIYLSCGLSEILACLLSVIWLSVIRGRVFDSMSFVRVTSATGAARPNYWASVRLSLLFWNVEGTIVSQLLLTWGNLGWIEPIPPQKKI